MKEVVGVAFFKDGKLLISQSRKSAKRNNFRFVGGGIEEGETVFQASRYMRFEKIVNNFKVTY